PGAYRLKPRARASLRSADGCVLDPVLSRRDSVPLGLRSLHHHRGVAVEHEPKLLRAENPGLLGPGLDVDRVLAACIMHEREADRDVLEVAGDTIQHLIK